MWYIHKVIIIIIIIIIIITYYSNFKIVFQSKKNNTEHRFLISLHFATRNDSQIQKSWTHFPPLWEQNLDNLISVTTFYCFHHDKKILQSVKEKHSDLWQKATKFNWLFLLNSATRESANKKELAQICPRLPNWPRIRSTYPGCLQSTVAEKAFLSVSNAKIMFSDKTRSNEC